MRRESESYGRQDSGCPQSPVTCTLVTRDIRKNYKYLKREMSADILLDYLVQHSILETDENEFLIGKCRAVKCDFILRKLLRHPERIQDFSTLIAESKEQGFECFRTLGSSPLSSRPPATENQVLVGEGLTSATVKRNLKNNREHLIREISKRVSNVSASIVDDFLEEDVISVSEHEQISRLKNTDEAANMILESIRKKEPTFYLKLLSILQTYANKGDRNGDLGNLLNCLGQSTEGDHEQEAAGEYKDMTVTCRLEDGKMSIYSKSLRVDKAQHVEVKITDPEGKVTMHIIKMIPDTEEMVVQGTHSSFESTSTGSIIILLQTESTYAMTKLKNFIENEGISEFLSRLFESSDVQRLLTQDKFKIDVQIRKLQGPPAKDTYRPELEFKYNACLKRCHGFLREELDPLHLLRDEEVARIFHPVIDKIKQPSTRTAKVEIFLEFLKEQPENKIKLVIEKLKEKNLYAYGQLFPNIEKYHDIDVELVRGNILDSLTELLNEVSVLAIQTPFLSTGLVSVEELNTLHANCESTRRKRMEFMKMVLHRGEAAIKVFLCALANTCGEDRAHSLLQQKDVCSESNEVRRHSKIEYEAFNEENGILFKGRFVLELKRNTGDEKRNEECLYTRKDENPKESEHPGNQSQESSSDSDPSNSATNDEQSGTAGNTSNKDIRIAKLESDCSEILSKLTRKLGRVEGAMSVKRIFLKQLGDYAQMDEVKKMHSHKYDKIREDCVRLRQTLKDLQSLRSVITEKNDEFDTGWEEMQIPWCDLDSETISTSEIIPRFERQDIVTSTDENSGDTTESLSEEEDDEEESLNVLNRQSSKYQSVLIAKLYNIKTVQSVMNIFRDMAEKDIQLMAIKNILNEEQYKKLETYIIKLQDISEKLQKTGCTADVA